MSTSREDVFQCYRTILGREPESDFAVNYHIEHGPTLWAMIQNFLDSEEYKIRHANGQVAGFLFKKGPYLATNISRKLACDCYFHNFNFMCQHFSASSFEKIVTSELVLYQLPKQSEKYEIIVRLSPDNDREGELFIELRSNKNALFVCGFSIIPGSIFGIHDQNAILISRMQGINGIYDDIKRATKDLGDISPQAILFCVVNGLAEAVSCQSIFGVSAVNHPSHTPDRDQVLRKTYDEFYMAVGGKRIDNNFFSIEPLLQQYSNQRLRAEHRNRTRRKRKVKAELIDATAQAWSQLFGR